MEGYLPTFQGRNKWKTLQNNLVPGQLVLVGDYEDLFGWGAYRLGRVHLLYPQIQQGHEVVRRATIAVLSKTSGDLEYRLRDLAKIAPV